MAKSKQRCTFIYANGTRCRRKAIKRGRCAIHQPKPVKKSTRKKLSTGVKKYWRKVRSIQKTGGFRDVRSARNYYKTQEVVKKTRYKRLVIYEGKGKKIDTDLAARPRYLKLKDYEKYGKVMKSGKDRGKRVVYYDTVKREVVGGKHALRQRRKLAEERLAYKMMAKTKTEQRFLMKFWPARAKKRGRLTRKEALTVSRKALKARRKDKRLVIKLREVFDES